MTTNYIWAVDALFDGINREEIQDKVELMGILLEDGQEIARLVALKLREQVEDEIERNDLCPKCYAETAVICETVTAWSMSPPEPTRKYCTNVCGWEISI